MARNLSAQWRQFCPERDRKILGICGGFHACLVPDPPPDGPSREFWPALATALQRDEPNRKVHTLSVVLHGGDAFYNGAIRPVGGQPLARPEVRPSERGSYSLELHLPDATPATFLAQPPVWEDD